MVDRNAEALANQLLALPAADRAHMAQLLLASLEGSDPDAAGRWDAEIAERAAALDRGAVQPVAAEAVFAAVERRLRR
jgi:putative addiction module component (TIGR02574 family)